MASDAAGGGTEAASSADGAWKREFKRNAALYLVFNLAGAMLRLVNKVELTFARSLVACEEPVAEGAMFTGSSWCGDRLYVIDQGQKLSATGQGQECFFKVLAMVFVAVFADVVGRKPALVVGLAGTGLSAVLFILATISPTWLAFRLFALGQGLQGAYPAELLGSIVSNDLSHEKGSDLVVVNSISGLMTFLFMLVTEIVGVVLNSSNLLDFRPIWIATLIANGALAIAAMLYCRETRPDFEKDDERKGQSVLTGVQREMREYVHLLWTNRMLRLNLMMYAAFSFGMCGGSIDMSFYMSFHKVPQDVAAGHFFWMFPIGVLCFGVVDKVCKRLGMRKGFIVLTSFWNIGDLFIPFYLLSPKVFMMHKYLMVTLSGMPPVTQAIDTRWFDQRLTSKFLSMKSLVEYIVGTVANPTYGWLFDATATTYVGKMAPYGMMIVAKCTQLFLLLVPIWRADGGLPSVLDRIQAEREQKEKEKEEAEGSSKKTD